MCHSSLLRLLFSASVLAATARAQLQYISCILVDTSTANDNNVMTNGSSPQACETYCSQGSYPYFTIAQQFCSCWAKPPPINETLANVNNADCDFPCDPPYASEWCGGEDVNDNFLFSYYFSPHNGPAVAAAASSSVPPAPSSTTSSTDPAAGGIGPTLSAALSKLPPSITISISKPSSAPASVDGPLDVKPVTTTLYTTTSCHEEAGAVAAVSTSTSAAESFVNVVTSASVFGNSSAPATTSKAAGGGAGPAYVPLSGADRAMGRGAGGISALLGLMVLGVASLLFC